MQMTISTLGSLELRRDGTSDPAFPGQRTKAALLVYVEVEGKCSRDRAMTLFWGDRSDKRARHLLNQTLYELRRDLHREAIRSAGDFLTSGDAMELDVRQLEHAWNGSEYAEILGLYRGHFLDGFHVPGASEFNDWADQRRRVYRQWHYEAHQHLIDEIGNSRESLTDLLRLAREWVRWHPHEEVPRHTLATALQRSGRVREALSEYERWERAVREELGRSPAAGLWDELLARLHADEPLLDLEKGEGIETPILQGRASRGPRLVRTIGQEHEVHLLRPGEIRIGRTEGDLSFNDNRSLSALHAEILVEQVETPDPGSGPLYRCVLRDLGSRHGTFLKIRGSRPIEDGEVFLAGRQMFQFRRT